MPDTTLTDAIKEAYVVAAPTDVIVNTLEIRQDGVQDPVFIADWSTIWIANDEDSVSRTFQPVSFEFKLPPSNDEGHTSMDISIVNIGREALDFIETAQTEEIAVKCIYRPYLSRDTSGPQMVPPLVLYAKDISINVDTINIKATFLDIVNKKFPSELYTHDRFPGL